MRHLKYPFIVLAVLFVAVFVFFLIAETNRTEANKHEFWITMDENELNTVRAELPEFKFNIKNVQNGIAVVHISNGDLERLSGEMHKHFHKCSGFIAHQTENEAMESVAASFSNTGNEQFIDYVIDNQANVNQLLPETREINVRQTIIDLSSYETRRHDQPTAILSAGYIKNKWEALANGREDITVEFFNHPTNVTPQPSVILTIQGTTSPNEVVVLGGHQDSIRSGSATALAPGADDDASGIASLTETIRVITAKNFRPKRTVKFMAYAAEEVGLRGSRDIATHHQTNNINVVGALQLDMTNYNANSSTIDFAFETSSTYVNVPQTNFIKELVTTYLPTMTYSNTTCGYGCSDHFAWHEKGYPASFPFEAPFGQHNNALHTVNDTISRSNNMAVQAEKFSKLALTYVGEIAKGEIPAVAPETKARFDFDGDNKTDVSIFRPGLGEWWYLKSSDGSNRAFQFGNSNDKLTPADYTGDGRTDISFWRESTAEIFVLRSEDSTFYSFPFGQAGDIPSPGDFDGDGKADVAVFRHSSGIWYINRSSDNQTAIVNFGIAGDKPVIADYDGDGIDDIAIYRPSNSQWWISRSQDGLIAYQFGSNGDRTMQGDWTGDGKADISFWRPSTGEWFTIRSEDNSFYAFPFGASGDIPTPGDFDGDGILDAVVFRPGNNVWYKLQSTNGFEAVEFGSSGDFPVPNVYVFE